MRVKEIVKIVVVASVVMWGIYITYSVHTNAKVNAKLEQHDTEVVSYLTMKTYTGMFAKRQAEDGIVVE